MLNRLFATERVDAQSSPPTYDVLGESGKRGGGTEGGSFAIILLVLCQGFRSGDPFSELHYFMNSGTSLVPRAVPCL